jgi:anaerobic magnesium-protoporphyrin IX monomethyl ester cyclase
LIVLSSLKLIYKSLKTNYLLKIQDKMADKKNLNIELIHPPHPQSIEDRLDAPLGLLYIASNLEKEGYSVKVNDLSGIAEKDWKIGKADIYGTTIYAPTVNLSEKIARICKETNPYSKIVAGGAHPTAVPTQMSNLFDIICIGEGEEAFIDIAKDYPNNKRFYKKDLERNLDIYPHPAYHLIDPFSYKRKFEGEQAITILTSRGCPYRCAFCGLAEQHKTMKYRSPENVVEEIKFIQNRYNINKFNFQDDTFTVNKRRLHKMLDMFKPLKIGFRAHGRSGLDTPVDYQKLKEAGCNVVAWGIESGSQKILDLMNKDTTVKQNEEVIKWAKEAGLTTRAFFVIGFPGEDKYTLEETKEFIERSNPDQYFVSNFVPYPGTDVWNNPKKYGVTKIYTDFEKYYQIDDNGFGSRNIEVTNLSNEEFKELEMEFRGWINHRQQRGSIQEYEEKIREKQKNEK